MKFGLAPLALVVLILPILIACGQPTPAPTAPKPTTEATPIDQNTKQAEPQTFSDDAYADLLAKHVDNNGSVNYAALLANRKPLDEFAQAMGAITQNQYDAWTNDAKLALWINAYNAYTLIAIIDHYPIQPGGLIARTLYPENSIRHIPGVWKELTWSVVGKEYTLDAMEHQVLRKDFADEPRFHMAIVCASIGCPPLRNEPFRAETLEEQLADQSRRFLTAPDKLSIDHDANVVHLSQIFNWFGKDFTTKYETDTFEAHSKTIRAVLNFVSQYADEESAIYLKSQEYSTDFTSYDWTLNEQDNQS